ncbi:MAG: cytochrome c biogenesis protein CcsA, partial [Bdellovibrionaceae bacterium]|nr:cytochrome c biogenesis protein CcsA [Pseudobdellovibrionaceae bacterium]
TNMYGTMIWVSFGILLFTFLILLFYKNLFLPGTGLIASGLLLLLTERLPLVLSPDLDPIVAVLRSNFWLSTHVTTITISYAAFSIAMILGNVALVRVLIYKDNTHFIKEYSHYAYRMIQLGCFLLTVGIILGGVWADYSWGRFWGWDPKETWALIADLGFLIILHGRFAGWVNTTSLLLWSPVAYLLVIMAWYGVNFILAAGLHSYGFSSGGTLMVLSFLGIQLCLLLAGGYKLWHQRTV